MCRSADCNSPRFTSSVFYDFIFNDFRQCHQGISLNPLGCIDPYRILLQKRCKKACRVSDIDRGNHHQKIGGFRGGCGRIRCKNNPVRNAHTREIRSFPLFIKLRRLLRKFAPYGNRMSVQKKDPCKGNSPCAGSKHSNLHISVSRYAHWILSLLFSVYSRCSSFVEAYAP